VRGTCPLRLPCSEGNDLPPRAGVAEAYTYAAGCLRLISIDEAHRGAVMAAGAPRYMAHLLDGRIHLARWHARQTMLNLAMVNEYAAELARYGLPDYVTGRNIPAVHYMHRCM
jgi:hypothetical protein